MIYRLMKILATGGLSLLLVSSLSAQVIPTNEWVDFYGSATAYNGNPIPVGSIIDAYDPVGIHCGSDTVTMAGRYGFLPVYGDDSRTAGGYDEGAVLGDTISFKINGRTAIPLGPDDPVWTGMGGVHEVNLSASAVISISPGTYLTSRHAIPGDTVRYMISVNNTGEGIDFYKISAVSAGGWLIHPQIGFAYALPGGTANICFDLYIPTMLFHDTIDITDFRVCSGIDTTVCFEGQVTTYVTMTDAPDSRTGILPGGFELYQNYPNPFNPSTIIAYDLPAASEVHLEIYNLLGQKIDALDLGKKSAGHYSFEYRAGTLPSGIYLYRLQAGDFKAVRKMTLIK